MHGCPRTIGQKPEPTIRRGTMVVGRGLAPAVFLFSTNVAVGEHSICSRKRKGGYGIRPYNIMEIYLFFRREQAPALRYEIVFSAKVAEAMDSVFLYNEPPAIMAWF